MVAGIYTIFFGLILFVCGLLCLFLYGHKERKIGNMYPVRRSLISLLILLFNFPAAALAVYSADYILSTSIVTVENNSAFGVTGFVLIEKDTTYYVPNIYPGRKISKDFHFKYEGSVHYRLSLNGTKKEGIVFAYVTGGLGEKATMNITKDGSVEISN